jgi:hypothetical protein
LSPDSTTAAAVSSQDVSIPRTYLRPGAGLGDEAWGIRETELNEEGLVGCPGEGPMPFR